MRKLAVLFVALVLIPLTSCGPAGQKIIDSSSQATVIAEDYLEGLWSYEITQTYGFEDQDPAPSCEYNLYDEWTCEFWFYVKNESKIPQDFDGFTYLVTDDGRIFESSNKPSYEKLNPGESRLESPRFEIPDTGIVATSIFRAWSATDNKYYQFIFPTLWSLSNSSSN